MVLVWGGSWKTEGCRRGLKEEELLDWVDVGGMNTTVVVANRISKCW